MSRKAPVEAFDPRISSQANLPICGSIEASESLRGSSNRLPKSWLTCCNMVSPCASLVVWSPVVWTRKARFGFFPPTNQSKPPTIEGTPLLFASNWQPVGARAAKRLCLHLPFCFHLLKSPGKKVCPIVLDSLETQADMKNMFWDANGSLEKWMALKPVDLITRTQPGLSCPKSLMNHPVDIAWKIPPSTRAGNPAAFGLEPCPVHWPRVGS